MNKNKKKWIIITVILLLVTNGLTFFATNNLSLITPNGKVMLTRSDYNEIQKFSKLFSIRNKLYKYYDGKIDDEKLAEGAVKGMTASLNDPYTVFMDKKEFNEFNSQTEGNYVGLGIQVGVKDNKIIVIAPFDGSPAEKAGIRTGDVIQQVNGKSFTGENLEKAVSMMKGKEGESVKITIFRAGKGNFDVTLKREKIVMNTIKGQIIENGIGYIQISMFDENTGKNFVKELDTLKKSGIKGLILDLRGNPGGLLTTCRDVTSNFVPKGKVIVSTIDKYGDKEELKSKGGNWVGMPLVVLVDQGTASASEILSGAVRDYKLGTLIGEKTFGKGVVQTVLNAGEGTALKVTVSKYYTPNGENIHHKGIEPNIKIEYPKELREKPYNRSLDPQFNKGLEVIKENMSK